MTRQMVFAVSVILLLLTSSVLYFLYDSGYFSSTEQSLGRINEEGQQGTKVRDSDVVAVFTSNPLPVEQNVTSSQEQNVAGATDGVDVKINAPEGWKLESEKTEKSTCEPNKEQKIQTFKKGEETLTIYENASPAGCENSVIGDVTVPFSYNDEGGMLITSSESYTQCTKEQNSTCPKGDGKVTLFVINVNQETKKDNPHPLNDKTYAFRIDDTKIDGDFNKQVADLLNSVGNVAFSYQNQ